MKRKLLAFLSVCLFIFSSTTLANNERILAATSDTQTPDPSVLGWVNPCDQVRFIVTYTIPSGYNHVKKFEWYFNNVLVKTSTSESDPGAILAMTAGNGPTVSCNVTYFNDQSGATSSPFAASTFSPQVRPIGLNPITQAGSLVLGCPGAASFSTGVITNNNLLYVPPPANYTLQWTLPANWSFSSGNTGGTITANSDGITGGNVAAHLQMNTCAYSTPPITLPISYATPAPVFSSSNPSATCGSSQSYAVNSICGAVSYTYTITGNTGCVFSNGLQSITTSTAAVTVSFPATGGNFLLNAWANYPNSVTSSSVTASYNFGLPRMTLTISKMVGTTFFANAVYIPGATYTWTLDTHSHSGTDVDGSFYDEDVTCGTVHHLSVYAVNGCGTTNTASTTVNIACGGGGGSKAVKVSVSPNPTQGMLKVSLADDVATLSSASGKTRVVKALRIVDKAGRIVRRWEFGTGVQEAAVNTGGLATDIYVLQVFDGIQWVHREIIVK